MISDWDEPSSETELDEGNKELCLKVAQHLRSDNDTDLSILNDAGNQLGGNASALITLAPVLADLNIHFALSTFEEAGRIKHDYVVFNPADLQITKRVNLSQQKKLEQDTAESENIDIIR